jgi:hypothetical protein
VTRPTFSYAARFALITVACLMASLNRGHAQTVQWIRQHGTTFHEDAIAVSADGLGNVYITGETNGSLGGPSAGGSDAFIGKYDSAGNLLWKNAQQVPSLLQIGTSAADNGYAISADGLGSVYMSGKSSGSLGGTNAGNADAFVTKWDNNGQLLWTRQVGTNADDVSYGVSADRLGNVYISGVTGGSLDGLVHTNSSAFLIKYDAAGNQLWTRQSAFSVSSASLGVSADRLGNVYTAGSVGSGAYLSKYDAAGTVSWTKTFNARGFVDATGVSADGLGNVYVAGYSDGSLGAFDGSNEPGAGGQEAFIKKYDAAGNILWSHQFGSNRNDYCFGVSADGIGGVYITGRTQGNLAGPLGGTDDAFVAKFDDVGHLVWTKQLTTSAYEGSLGVSADGLGNVYSVGGTDGSLGAPNVRFGDAFVAKISDVPEPATGVHLALAAVLLPFRRISTRGKKG